MRSQIRRSTRSRLALGPAGPGEFNAITTVSLAGGGDGHTFVCTVVGAPVPDTLDPLPPNLGPVGTPLTALRFALAANAAAVTVAMDSLRDNPSPPPGFACDGLYGLEIGGAGQGTRFMVLHVCQLEPIPPP